MVTLRPGFERFYQYIKEYIDLPREGVDRDEYEIWRELDHGWFAVKGPTCTFFVGESYGPDETEWVSFGPIVRRTHVESDGEGKPSESFIYRLRESGRERLADTPLAEGPEDNEAWEYFVSLHERVVDRLRDNDLLYDGWVVWPAHQD